jgi:hypothetical protein
MSTSRAKCDVLCAITLPEQPGLGLSAGVTHCQPPIGQTPSRASVSRHLRPLASLAVILGFRFDTEEVRGSSPPGPTISSNKLEPNCRKAPTHTLTHKRIYCTIFAVTPIAFKYLPCAPRALSPSFWV